MIELVLFLVAAFIGSGVLFQHKRALTYLAFAGVIFEMQMIISAFVRRSWVHDVGGNTFYLIAGIIWLTIFIALYKRWKSPYSTSGSGKRDGFVGIALVIIIALAYPIISSNGYHGENFVLHGFYNGDTVTFASLVNKSFITSSLVQQNPFAANGPLEYPTLLHGAFADFFSLTGIGSDWLHFLPIISYIQIFITIPMFFLLWDVVFPEPKNESELWFGIVSRNAVYSLQVILTLIAIGLSLDSYIYPQSHFFLIGLFLATIALLFQAHAKKGRSQLLPVIFGYAIAIALLLANTVTGTAAAGLAGVFAFIRIFDRKRSVLERSLYLITGLVVLLLMRAASTSRVSFFHPHFSISSAGDMLSAGLPYLFVIAAAIYALSRKQFLAISSILVGFLGIITFFLADRNIVTENASRFLYHGFLIGFSLLLAPIIQYIYFLKREIRLTSRPAIEIITGYVGVLALGLITFLPIGISAGSTYSNLLKNDAHTISFNTQIALWWIEQKTNPNDIIIANPNEPFVIPLFTSKALLRTNDYWLSLQDETKDALVKAFSGDKKSQQEVLAQGNYLLVTPEEQKMWGVSKLKKVFESPDAIVYQIH
ncbi:MAG TPA: hypothetical protein VLG69_00455 [Candidatus Andersenbacteria bacterium]|nr:hypothetical protein [Candidatus Andersenbacteria bacterium]